MMRPLPAIFAWVIFLTLAPWHAAEDVALAIILPSDEVCQTADEGTFGGTGSLADSGPAIGQSDGLETRITSPDLSIHRLGVHPLALDDLLPLTISILDRPSNAEGNFNPGDGSVVKPFETAPVRLARLQRFLF